VHVRRLATVRQEFSVSRMTRWQREVFVIGVILCNHGIFIDAGADAIQKAVHASQGAQQKVNSGEVEGSHSI
jgi:hypothetical protein